MTLVESQALLAGQPIGIPSLPEDYYPLNVNRYVTIQPFTKPAKTYSYWQDVLDIIAPVLNQLQISVVVLGGPNEPKLNGAINLAGQTSLAQSNYILKRGIAHLGVDSWAAHAAGIFNVPLLILYANNRVSCVKPYWGDPDKQILMDCYDKDELPIYTLDEGPVKRIDKIKPETIAFNFLKLLKIDLGYKLETVTIGPAYNNPILEMVPTANYNPAQFGTNSIMVRMDYLFNEEVLIKQAEICHVAVVTNKPINLDLLNRIKGRIMNFVYIIDENHNPEFAKQVSNLGVNYQFISWMSEEELNKIKLDYCDSGLIIRRDVFNPKTDEKLKDIDLNNLLFKTQKYLLFNGKIYTTYAHAKADQQPTSPEKIHTIIDDVDFWKESDFFYLLKLNQ